MSEVFGTILYIYNPVNPKSMSKKLFELLAAEHYILYFNGQLVVTNKFLRDFKEPPVEETIIEIKEKTEPLEVMVVHPEPPTIPGTMILPESPTSLYRKFILECGIPKRVPTRDGSYQANAYSIKAEKEFMNILKKGYDYNTLMLATKLYYKSGSMPKAVTNYILDGIWMGCYEDLVESAKQGNANEYIKQNLDKGDEEGHTKYER